MEDNHIDPARLDALNKNIGIVVEAQERAERIMRNLNIDGYLDAIAIVAKQLKALDRMGLGLPVILKQINVAIETEKRIRALTEPSVLPLIAPTTSIPPSVNSSQSDELLLENAQLRKDLRRLEDIIRHYESQSPKDLPDHDVDGRFGSPN